MSDYLVDKEGPPDPEVERLERLLGGYRYRGRPPAPPRRWVFLVVAAAAAAVLWLALRPRDPHFAVESLEGAPRCAAEPCRALAPGDALVTDSRSRARVALGAVGRLDVEPDTALRRGSAYRLALLHGEVRAEVLAPPRLVVIETPSATAVDLGCAYTLNVDEHGDGRLAVTSGWVALEAPTGTVFVPRGAEAALHAGGAPGTPLFSDASAELRAALAKLDASLAAGGLDGDALRLALAAGRRADTLSFYNLLPRLRVGDRAAVLDRMLALGAPPPKSRDPILAADPDALEAWRHTLSAIWL